MKILTTMPVPPASNSRLSLNRVGSILLSLPGIVVSMALFTVFSWAQPATRPVNSLEGIWQGSLKVAQSVELRIILHVTREKDGVLKATLDSPDQGAAGIPVDSVRSDTSAVVLSLRALAASYSGTMTADGATIRGTWRQGASALPLEFRRTEKLPVVSRPQEPKPPYPYATEDVTFQNESAGITLAGTLTRPQSGGPFPAVLLITGSGPEDRDETVFGHRPFLVLADYLTRHGVAVLRADDRGVGKSTGRYATATSADLSTDVKAGLRYLGQRGDIDHSKIGLIGHSEGGIIAPMVAATSSDVAFIVLLAGTGVTGEDILYRQAELIARAGGEDEKAIEKNHLLQAQLFRILKEEPDTAIAGTKMRAAIRTAMAAEAGNATGADSTSDAAVEQQVKPLLSPWFRYFLTYDPKPALRRVRCPVLVLNGQLDLQVPPAQNLPAIETALREGGNDAVTVRELTGLNHLFQHAKTGSPMEYASIEETFSPAAMDTIAQWIFRSTRR